MTSAESESESRSIEAGGTFEGFERVSGEVGVRNAVLVLPSVICSRIVAERIAEGVEEAICTPHDHGCGQIGADAEQTERALLGVARNPNVAGTLVVGLGCETIQSDHLADRLEAEGHPVREVAIQDEGGSDPCIERGVEAARELVNAGRLRRTTAELSDLTVGVVGSDLREPSVERADPLVGSLVERVVDEGGRVLVGGTERILPHADEVAASVAVGATDSFEAMVARRAERFATEPRIQRTARERSSGEITRLWADRPIADVRRYGDRPDVESGVVLVDTPSEFAEAATGLAAAGAQVVVHVTDEGIPTGHPVVPTIRVTGNSETYAALSADIDVNARETTTEELHELLVDIANGEPSRAERHGLTEFAITRIGPSM